MPAQHLISPNNKCQTLELATFTGAPHLLSWAQWCYRRASWELCSHTGHSHAWFRHKSPALCPAIQQCFRKMAHHHVWWLPGWVMWNRDSEGKTLAGPFGSWRIHILVPSRQARRLSNISCNTSANFHVFPWKMLQMKKISVGFFTLAMWTGWPKRVNFLSLHMRLREWNSGKTGRA